jgi:SAM-dependent methyltransferase
MLAALRSLARERVTGLDFSAGMLAEAKARAAAQDRAAKTGDGAPLAPIELVRADAIAMEFDAAFDVVTCVGAFGHILEADEARFAAGIHRALRPGGRFVFATAELPPRTSASWWLARGFNAAMRIRNALVAPPFVMYYLTFAWPGVRAVLEAAGFSVELAPLPQGMPAEYARLKVVVAAKS